MVEKIRILKDIVCIRLVFRRPSIFRKLEPAALAEMKGIDGYFIRTLVRIIDSETMDEIGRLVSKAHKYLKMRNLRYGSLVRKFMNTYLIPAKLYDQVLEKLQKVEQAYNELADQMMEEYPDMRDRIIKQVEQAKANAEMVLELYPSPEEFRKRFSMEMLAYIMVPEERSAAQAASLVDAIADGLRNRFNDLVESLNDRLDKVVKQEAKKLSKSQLKAMQDFVGLFDSLNVTEDSELAGLVSAVKAILADYNPADLREPLIAQRAQERLAPVVDASRKLRKFCWDDEN